MSSFQNISPKVASFALQKLRDASEQIPEVSEKEGIGFLLKEVKNANEEISKCEKSYQEKAELLNKTIAHSISNIVDKGLVEMEDKLKILLTVDIMDLDLVDSLINDLTQMKEKLVYFFDLVSGWGWSHLRRVQRERIAEVYEKIDQTADKVDRKLEEASTLYSVDQKDRVANLQEKLKGIIVFGSDCINPDEIFSSD